MISGIAASSGYAIGHAILLEKKEITISTEKSSSISNELKVLEDTILETTQQLQKIYEQTKVEIGEEEAMVFESHLMMLEDPEFMNLIKKNIEDEGYQVAYAVQLASDFFVEVFENMDNEYMRARAADIKDIADRMIRISLGEMTDAMELPKDAIIIAKDLTPSDTAQLDKNKVKGFITEVGSKTSHSAIMARSMGIPAVVGVADISEILKGSKEKALTIINGFTGEIIINPEQSTIKTYEDKVKSYNAEKEALKKYKDIKLQYTTGRKVSVAGNIGSVDDLQLLLEQGAEGVGLFRTEFLFMGRNEMPSEEEQFNIYKQVAEKMPDHPVVIRTLDIGGDKVISYMNMPKEDNPFLGLRALRLCFSEVNLFKIQLRAILRASIYGNLHIMFPMIGAVSELDKAYQILRECMNELQHEGTKYDENIPIGMMIEIPAAAINAAEFAKKVDFFSIGTNDLVQYTLAVDRMNTEVAHLYDPFHPAVLELIKNTINAAHNANIWCGMCGEMASDVDATKILSSYELDEFSVTGSAVLQIKAKLLEQTNVKQID